jgi:flagellar assembly protein FliH
LSEQKKNIENIAINNTRIINSYKDETDKQAGLSRKELNSEKSEDGFVPMLEKKMTREHENSKDILDDAKKKADEIIEKAKKKAAQEAEVIKNKAEKEGYKKGYDEGKLIGAKEYEKMKQEVLHEKEKLITEKKNLITSVEQKIADIIKELVINLIGIHQFNDETIINLIRKGFEEVELYDDLIIRVSQNDYDNVMEKKHLLTEKLSQKVTLEILKDMNLNENDCIIETELGNINCSLDLRLNGLINELQLIGKSMNSSSEEG